MKSAFALFGGLLLLAACGAEEGRGGLTAEEESQLDNAARMLDEIDVSPDSLVANESDLAIDPPSRNGTEPATDNAQ